MRVCHEVFYFFYNRLSEFVFHELKIKNKNELEFDQLINTNFGGTGNIKL